jgi:hypothetical protein
MIVTSWTIFSLMLTLAIRGDSSGSVPDKLRTIRLHVDGFSKSKSGAV